MRKTTKRVLAIGAAAVIAAGAGTFALACLPNGLHRRRNGHDEVARLRDDRR